MARIRTIKPQFFRSHDLFQAEIAANRNRKLSYLNVRVGFAGIITASDREGRFQWRPAELKLDCLPYDPIDFGDILAVLAAGKKPFVVRYEVSSESYGWIPGFKNHQRPHPEEAQSKLPPPPTELQSKYDRSTIVVQSMLGRESGVLSLDNNRNGSPSAVDFSEIRFPYGKHKGTIIANLPIDECKLYLKDHRLGKCIRKALTLRIEAKMNETIPEQRRELL